MKVFLMHRDRDFDPGCEPPPNAMALLQDLELSTLLDAMAMGDPFLLEIAGKAVLTGLKEEPEILYRQDVLRDCLDHSSTVRELYGLAVETIENKKRHWWGFTGRSPDSILYSARELMDMFAGSLKKLRKIADDHAKEFQSEGFSRFFSMLACELDDEYLSKIGEHLKELKFRNGVLVSAGLGTGNKGAGYTLRKPHSTGRGWFRRMFSKPGAYTFCISDRDEAGARALADLRARGINLVADALARSADHILGFFNALRTELAFYVACVNLHERLVAKGEPVCFPVPFPADARVHSFMGLYDVCLTLTMEQRAVGNDMNADGKDVAIITGANRGGKSTFLRSIGLAQLLMQCGMFAPAGTFSSNICRGLFTHYKREEDQTMKSGKFDEELGRMSDIADNVRPDALVLFNESFAATNEREGSEIAGQITRALLEKRIKVFYVTHLYEFAGRFCDEKPENAIFLRAERETDGVRTFRIVEGEPEDTSYGRDLYYTIFERAAQ
ncbi:MAG: MutS-related protein [Syntrophobacteraceae bacterium]